MFKRFTYYYSDVVYRCNHILYGYMGIRIPKSSIIYAYPQNDFLITIQPKTRQIWFYVNLLRYDLCLMVLCHASLLFVNIAKLI